MTNDSNGLFVHSRRVFRMLLKVVVVLFALFGLFVCILFIIPLGDDEIVEKNISSDASSSTFEYEFYNDYEEAWNAISDTPNDIVVLSTIYLEIGEESGVVVYDLYDKTRDIYMTEELVSDSVLDKYSTTTRLLDVDLMGIGGSDYDNYGVWGIVKLISVGDPPALYDANIFFISSWDDHVAKKYPIPSHSGLLVYINRERLVNEREVFYEWLNDDGLTLYYFDLDGMKEYELVSYTYETFSEYCDSINSYALFGNEFFGGCGKDRKLNPKWLPDGSITYTDFVSRNQVEISRSKIEKQKNSHQVVRFDDEGY
ncbi:MAG: hypothetical protein KAS07_05690 [Candidatus Pacebacteria bacterium]|nr:hypothetical protein [Candidatus Paceibacterota bacterium]